MLNAKFQNHRPTGSEEHFKGFCSLKPRRPFIQTFVPFPSSLALIGHAVAEMFEYFGHMHVYSPRAGADKPLGTKCFHEHKSSVPLHAHREFPPI